jgi:guanosine-3',5'-bis(diphosphate) 3'-pyrophosphohydrolase
MSASGSGDLSDAAPIVREAFQLASKAHEGQSRRDNGRPYIEHPLAVAELLHGAGFDGEVVAAALLHDVVENTEMGVDDVARAFGDRVAELVDVLTEDEAIEPFARRKRALRGEVERGGADALAIYAADKLSNARGLRRLYASEGERSAARFDAPLDVRVALWQGDLEMLRRAAPALPFLDQLAEELERLRSERAGATAAVNSS